MHRLTLTLFVLAGAHHLSISISMLCFCLMSLITTWSSLLRTYVHHCTCVTVILMKANIACQNIYEEVSSVLVFKNSFNMTIYVPDHSWVCINCSYNCILCAGERSITHPHFGSLPLYWLARLRSPKVPHLPDPHASSCQGSQGHECTHCCALQVRLSHYTYCTFPYYTSPYV